VRRLSRSSIQKERATECVNRIASDLALYSGAGGDRTHDQRIMSPDCEQLLAWQLTCANNPRLDAAWADFGTYQA
jgi:hypothetical protein